MGAMKASQDENAQRGMAVLLEALHRLGEGVSKVERRQKLAKHLGSRAPQRSPARQRFDAAPRRPQPRESLE